jgi:hypothetical protein
MGIDNDRPGPGLTDNRIITGRISELWPRRGATPPEEKAPDDDLLQWLRLLSSLVIEFRTDPCRWWLRPDFAFHLALSMAAKSNARRQIPFLWWAKSPRMPGGRRKGAPDGGPGFFTFGSEAFAEMQIIEIIIVRIINRELHKK